jgi:hypothetical protein
MRTTPSGERGGGSIGNTCFGTPVKLPVKTITWGLLDTASRRHARRASPERLKMNARFAVPMTGKTKCFQRAFISKFD